MIKILIVSSQIAKIFDKKEKTVATKGRNPMDKYETENVKLLKKIWINASGCC